MIAYQLHRSDLDSGIVLAFRRSECPYPALQTGLRGLNAEATYLVKFIDEKRASRQQTVTGTWVQITRGTQRVTV